MAAHQIKQLCEASVNGDLKTVKQLLAGGANPNAKGEIHTPLMLAARPGHEDVFFELVRAGADLHGKGLYGGSVLIAVAGKGTPRMLQTVIADGIRESDDLPMALVNACEIGSVEAVATLIDAGAAVNPKQKSRSTPLLCAARRNRPEIVAELLKRGANTAALMPRSNFGQKKHFKKTALEIAELEGFTQVAELLRAAGAKPPAKPARPQSPGTVAESWKLFKRWQKENAPDWKALNKGAGAKKIEAAERQLGRELPAELRESYRLHDGGGQMFPSATDISFCLMPLAEVVAAWESQKELLEGGDFDPGGARSAKGIRKEWWNIAWVPFASNGGGDYFCVDLDPAAGGTIGQVISHNHETGEHHMLAVSFCSLLSELVASLQDGKYSFDEDEECIA